ncbi:hydroxyacid dehydrogenase [Ferrovibrio sp.]|uniref:hydroxyacid dehydrogenase n=1 Tax=Ferrovibrio sp. TaxID=1917215 RepID=UPI000CB998CC|nr:hydroxyacid dehydrogenase [Ferrovibrio sp.]PJI40334.1 MAG: hydroxyacid dehydrogenase [Ferrovibrio sp.]
MRADLPIAILAMDPKLTPDLIQGRHLQSLEQLVNVARIEPVKDFSETGIGALLSRVEILITGWGCPEITPIVLARMPKLGLLVHTGSSVRPVAGAAVWERGIRVVSAAVANAPPVAEYCLAMILLANKEVFYIREAYRSGTWAWQVPWPSNGLTGNNGATVGIIGASRIGRKLIELLKPFDLGVLLCDPTISGEEAAGLGVELVGLNSLLERSDIVTIQAPSLPSTYRMIGAEQLALMRNGSTLLNTARGALVDLAALEKEVTAGRLKAILDVSDPEPLGRESPLLSSSNAFVTPHIAGATGAETHRLMDLAIEEIRRHRKGEPLRHEVTHDMLDRVA